MDDSNYEPSHARVIEEVSLLTLVEQLEYFCKSVKIHIHTPVSVVGFGFCQWCALKNVKAAEYIISKSLGIYDVAITQMTAA